MTSVNAGTAPQDTVGIAAGQPNAAQTKWYAKPASTYWAWTSCGYFRDYIDYSVNDTETRLRAVKKPITASSDLVPSRFMRKIVCRLRLNEVSRQ